MTASYQSTFGTRSSFRQRSQTLDHLQDLALLLPVDDPRRAQLEKAISTLSAWAGATMSGSGSSAIRQRQRRRRCRSAGRPAVPPGLAASRCSSVHVEALPASYGDAILVTYGDDRHQSRMLIDAGPANAFKKGVRPRLGDMHLDLLVITHVDADHIDGAVQLLLDKNATFDDIWFNGWRHLPPSRGGREGAMLDALLTGKPWNLAFDGGVIQVPEQGPLPSVMVAGGARVTLLSPAPDGLQRLRRTWQKALDEVSVQPGNATEALELLARDRSLRRAGAGRGNGEAKRILGRDQSVPNGSSIAFLFEFGHSACLFGGDALRGRAGVIAAPALAAGARRAEDQARPVQARPPRQPRQHHRRGARVDRLRPVPRVDGRLEVQPPRCRRDPAHQQDTAASGRSSRTTRRSRRAPTSSNSSPTRTRSTSRRDAELDDGPTPLGRALGEEVGRARVRLAAVRAARRARRSSSPSASSSARSRIVSLPSVYQSSSSPRFSMCTVPCAAATASTSVVPRPPSHRRGPRRRESGTARRRAATPRGW